MINRLSPKAVDSSQTPPRGTKEPAWLSNRPHSESTLRSASKRNDMTAILNGLINPIGLRSAIKQFKANARDRKRRSTFWNWTAEDESRSEFYQIFIKPGATVFDIGCNLGNRAKVFIALGATVVGVEPQPACADFLAQVFHQKKSFHLVRQAMGASPGTAEMFISNANTISSLSKDWIESVEKTGRFTGCNWDRRETVAVDTLDNLIDKFGKPDFIKIDVEGFEDQVIAGLSTAVNALSLEFTPEYIAGTFRCIEHLENLGGYRYQLALGEDMNFRLPEWLDAAGIKRILQNVSETEFGDIYAQANSVRTDG